MGPTISGPGSAVGGAAATATAAREARSAAGEGPLRALSAWLPRLLLPDDAPARYPLAILLAALAFGARLAAAPFFGSRQWLLALYPGVLAAALLCGFGPGLAATLLSAALAWLWLLPRAGSMAIALPPDRVGLALFVLQGTFMAWVVALYRASRLRYSFAARSLALRAVEARHRAFFENLQELVVLYRALRDERGAIVDWVVHDSNARTRAFLEAGYRAAGVLAPDEPMIGKRLSALAPPARRAEEVTEQWTAALEGVPASYQVERAGRTFAVTAFRTGDDLIATLAFDVTERERVAAALQEQLALQDAFAKVAASVPGLVSAYRRHPDGRVTFPYTNEWAEEVFGFSSEELARDAAPVLARNHPEDAARFELAVRTSARDLTPFHEELRYQHPRKGLRWLEIRSMPTREPDGATTWYGLVADVTERKEAEAALRESDRRKSEFLAVLSHELRNPLGPILNGLWLLDRAPPGSDLARRARAAIERQARHLTSLVDDLLDVTRISRGRIELRRARVDLREVVRRTCEDHRASIELDGLALALRLPDGAVPAEVDTTRIAQVLGNLLQNAQKFTPAPGRVEVEVAAEGGEATIRVRDTGVGIDPHLREQVFEPFVQAERTLARTGGGLGLGLALVKGLVGLHGGTVSARSDGLGAGAEFVVRLPAAPAAAEAPPPPAVRRAQAGGLQVLIVEDNADAAETLAAVMELEGHAVRVAPDGRTGLRLARERRPDVVLCDIGLPDISGFEVAEALRADPALRGIRLVAVTGYAQPEHHRRAREAGFDALVGKPAPLDALAAAIAGEARPGAAAG